MIDQEEFQCSVCGDVHYIIYNTMLLGPPEEISKSGSIQLREDIYKYNDLIFLKGVIIVPLKEQERHLEWINWVRIKKEVWSSFVDKESSEKVEQKLEGELVFELLQYEGSKGLKVMVGFTDTYNGFVFFDLSKSFQLGIDQRNGLTDSQLKNLFERLYHNKLVEEAKKREKRSFSTTDINLALSKLENMNEGGVMHIINEKQVIFQVTKSGNLEFFQDETDMNILGIDIPVDISFDREKEKKIDEYKHISNYRKGEVDGIILYQRLFRDDLENMKIEIYEIAKEIFGTSAENIEFEVFKA